jgi:hypothetical protein
MKGWVKMINIDNKTFVEVCEEYGYKVGDNISGSMYIVSKDDYSTMLYLDFEKLRNSPKDLDLHKLGIQVQGEATKYEVFNGFSRIIPKDILDLYEKIIITQTVKNLERLD